MNTECDVWLGLDVGNMDAASTQQVSGLLITDSRKTTPRFVT